MPETVKDIGEDVNVPVTWMVLGRTVVQVPEKSMKAEQAMLWTVNEEAKLRRRELGTVPEFEGSKVTRRDTGAPNAAGELFATRVN